LSLSAYARTRSLNFDSSKQMKSKNTTSPPPTTILSLSIMIQFYEQSFRVLFNNRVYRLKSKRIYDVVYIIIMVIVVSGPANALRAPVVCVGVTTFRTDGPACRLTARLVVCTDVAGAIQEMPSVVSGAALAMGNRTSTIL